MKHLTALLFLACTAAAPAAPAVTNVRASQRAGSKLVDVLYDLTGTGAFGSGVTPGTNKLLVWNGRNLRFGAGVGTFWRRGVHPRRQVAPRESSNELEHSKAPAAPFPMQRGALCGRMNLHQL